MIWALLGVGAWAALVAWRRDGLARAIVLAAGCGAGGARARRRLALAVRLRPDRHAAATKQVYDNSLAMRRPYAFWVLGSPVAWGVMTGVPIIAAGCGPRGGRPRRSRSPWSSRVAALGGFTKAETERIWLFLVPLACAAAAPWIGAARLRGVLAFLAVQAVLVQVLFETVW